MHSFLSNLALLAQLLMKVGILCGFIVSVLFVYVAEAWAKAFRVPARKLFRKVVSDESQSQLRALLSLRAGHGDELSDVRHPREIGRAPRVFQAGNRSAALETKATHQEKICARVGTHPNGSQFGDVLFRDGSPSRKKVRKA